MPPEKPQLNLPMMLVVGALGAIAGVALAFGVRAIGMT